MAFAFIASPEELRGVHVDFTRHFIHAFEVVVAAAIIFVSVTDYTNSMHPSVRRAFSKSGICAIDLEIVACRRTALFSRRISCPKTHTIVLPT